VSQTYAPLQLYNLLKSCMIVFVVQALAYIFLFPTITDLSLRLLILILNVLISGLLGWPLYRRRYHMILTYDNTSFTLKKGVKEEISHKWKEFSRLSLFRTEEGYFSVRLYKDSEFFDLPASKLKLNPFKFRSEVTQLVFPSKDKR